MSRIVVIEDDPAILRGLADNLRRQSYDVLTAMDGDTGYRLVRDANPDLVVLDLMLPGLNGFDVCREMRRHGLATPILMLTAQNQEIDRVRGFDAGADDYVTKPFSIREVLGRVQAILRRSEGRSDLVNQRELDDARRIQQRLIPTTLPSVPGLQFASAWVPARIACGDYFDILPFDSGEVAVCIGDVSGKGMPAAMVMSNLQAAVRTCAAERMPPRELCARVNRVMHANLNAYGFVTFFYAVISSSGERLTYCNAGHNPPLLATRTGPPQLLDCGGGVLGVIADWPYEEQVVPFRAGDALLMYTDGVTESRNHAGDEFGPDRLADLAERHRQDGARGLVDATTRAVREFTGGTWDDDLTVLAVAVE